MSKEKDKIDKDPSQDFSKIDTTGTTISYSNDGKLVIALDKRVTSRSFKEVLEYLYTDRVNWDRETDVNLIREVQDAAKYLQIKKDLK